MGSILKYFLESDRKFYVLEFFKLTLTLVISVKLYGFLYGVQLKPIPISENYLGDFYHTLIDGSIFLPIINFLFVWFFFFFVLQYSITLPFQKLVLKRGYMLKQRINKQIQQKREKQDKNDSNLLNYFNVYAFDQNGFVILGSTMIEIKEILEEKESAIDLSFFKNQLICLIQFAVCAFIFPQLTQSLSTLGITSLIIAFLIYAIILLALISFGTFLIFRKDVVLQIIDSIADDPSQMSDTP